MDGPASSCIQAAGNTSYSEALRQAQAELNRTGANVPNYIVFLTDGEANIGSVYGQTPRTRKGMPTTRSLATQQSTSPTTTRLRHDDLQHRLRTRKQRRLHGRRASANNNNGNGNGNDCTATATDDATTTRAARDESPSISSFTTLSQIASPGNFYNQPSAGQLDTIFSAIATDIGQGSSRLVDDSF